MNYKQRQEQVIVIKREIYKYNKLLENFYWLINTPDWQTIPEIYKIDLMESAEVALLERENSIKRLKRMV